MHEDLSLIALPDRVRQARAVRFALHATTRYAAAWLLALGLGAGYLHWAWHFFDEPRRADGNQGHVFIDFGGQWLLGRMIAEGHGRQLYHRGIQREVICRSYPRAAEIPTEYREPDEMKAHDAEELFDSLMGSDDREALGSLIVPLANTGPLPAVALVAFTDPYWKSDRLAAAVRPRGGPLYPPVAALGFAALGLLPPQSAYRVMQVANILFAFVAGLGVYQVLRGRVWWPVASAAILVYPGFPGTACLGQNASLTLAILVWGWALVARGHPGCGGVVWGLFAYKPVWGVAFFLIPLLTGRWRMCLTMGAGGLALVALTLPVVGVQSWLDWLHVGQLANAVYNTDLHWIFLSRDLLSIPRRWLLDFSDPVARRDRLAAALVGWLMLSAVLATTTGLTLWRRDQSRAVSGPSAAFVFLGAWLCCFHFMYYDVLLTALPVLLLFDEPRRYLKPRVLVTVPLETGQSAVNPRALRLVNNFVLTILGLLAVTEYVHPHMSMEVFIWAAPLAPFRDVLPQPVEFTTNLMGTPWNTFLLLSLWLWSGWWMRKS